MAYKTPGVYVQEISLFPPSVAEVATAIPAFIGYTQIAVASDGKSLKDEPTRIKSLLEYESLFGYDYVPDTITLTLEAVTNAIKEVAPDKRFLLYTCLKQYFDNGGGPCYIVSVGSYSDTITYQPMSDGMAKLSSYDEPTLILFPDAVALLNASNEPDLIKFSQLQKEALSLCASMQDRFCIFDILQGDKSSGTSVQPIDDFRDEIGVNNLNYGAAYYPWVVTSYTVDVDFRQLVFQDDTVPANPIDEYSAAFSKNATETALVAAIKSRIEDTDLVLTQIPGTAEEEKELMVNGTASLSDRLGTFAKNVAKNITPDTNLESYMNLLGSVAASFLAIEAVISLSPSSPLNTDISRLKADTKLTDAIVKLVSVEKNTHVIANMPGARDAEALFYGGLDDTEWLQTLKFSTVTTDLVVYTHDSAGAVAIIQFLKDTVTTLLSSFDALLGAVLYYEEQAESALWTGHTFFTGVSNAVTLKMRTVPPSGSVAGVYAYVDNARGVWKAPANVSLNNVIGPVVKIDNSDQDDMNVTDTGKSVNAIRSFAGKGTLVWGARTLAGNDNEWRYVPVRRFFIMVEESVKKATFQFVFESNDANTWTKLRMMVQNFLTLQWRAGALQGAKPEDAFFVNVGLHETMTAEDILEGRLIVEIGMAVVRPAEFIILRFTHLMQDK